MIYMLSYILLVIEGVILEKSTNVKGRHIFLIISYLQLTLILGLRAQSVGIDTESYIAYFKLVSLGISGWMEPGITGISKVILLLGGNQQLLLLICAIVTVAGFYYFIINTSDDIYLSVLILYSLNFYFFFFNGIRQSIAMAITSVAIVKINREQYYRAILWVILGMLFHTTASIVFVCIAIKKLKIKYKKNYVYILGILGIILVIAGRDIVNILSKLYTKYAAYMDSSFGQQGNIINPILFMCIYVFCSYYYKRIKNKENELLIIMLALGVILYFLSIKVQIVNRLAYFFTISSISLIPNVIVTFKDKVVLQWRWFIRICMGIYLFLLIERNAQGVMPYLFFWSESK